MLGKEFDERVISFAVVGFGTKIDDEVILAGSDNLFLGGTGFDGDAISHTSIIIYSVV